ncbi:dihydrofolate reductase [Marinicella rhabdoformis]|uniref:dihydrofolate reductase n=1 Tax=Marinicella rhabdoformis TaxID=2580566 RepID=UPI0012AEDBC2|nr:dihydrofolate reductase [Marinicella rhabdoformis]
MTQLTLIAAMGENRVIGNNNDLPWHLPADLKNFKAATLGKTVLMGRKTCESLPFALPKRKNLVLSRNPDFYRKGFETITGIENLPDEEIMVIGGAHIYQWLLPNSNKMILTYVTGEFEGDAYFPEIDNTEWSTVMTTNYPINKSNPKYDFVVKTYIRN